MKFLFAFLLISVAWDGVANAKNISADFVVDSGVSIDSEDVYIEDTIKFENNGDINTDIHICDGCEVWLRNGGSINSNIFLGANANLIQIVSGAGDVNKINVDKGYSVLVDSVAPVELESVVRMSGGADKIMLKNATLDISSLSGTMDANIELVGDVSLIVSDVSVFKDGLILQNVSGTGTLNLLVQNSDDLYKYSVVRRGSQVFVTVNRETDFDKIKDNIVAGDKNDSTEETDKFWDDLYADTENNVIRDELNGATDSDAIKDVLMESVRFNPDILRRPIQIIHAFDMANVGYVTDGVYFEPSVLMNDDSVSYFGGLGFGTDLTDNLNLRMDVRFGTMDYSGRLDSYHATFYGGNLALNYVPDTGVFVRMGMGGMLTRMDVGKVLYDNQVIYNPDVLSGYMVVDSGWRFSLGRGFHFMPFVGVSGQLYRIDDFKYDDVAGRGGVSFGYSSAVFGVKYKYEFNAFVDSDDAMSATIGMDVIAPVDMVAGNLNFGIVRMLDVTTYKISAGARLMF